ncbi:MAG: hypothetical protein HYX76_05330, partial [Acidobacteria bacterium]|nr:hypothetical protein [Acidobacteriota bacterium]
MISQEPQDLLSGFWLLCLFVTLSALGMFYTRKHRETLPYQFVLLLTACAIRFLASIVVYRFGLVEVLGDEDSRGWWVGVAYQRAWRAQGLGFLDLPETWLDAFDNRQKGYYYLLGTLFYITDAPARFPAAALNCALGGLTAVVAYRLARILFPERVARMAGWATCLFPSLIIWSAQTIKEPVVILLESLTLYCCLNLRRGPLATRYVIGCLVTIFLVLPFRFYAAYIGGAAAILALLSPNMVVLRARQTSRGVAIMLAMLAIPAMYIAATIAQTDVLVAKFDLEYIEKVRDAGASKGSGIESEYDLETPTGLGLATINGAAHLLLSPFPWELGGGSLRMLLTMPELVVWWWVFFFGIIPGVIYAIRRRFVEVVPLFVYIGGLGLLYSIMFSNIGLVYRQRAQLMPWLLIFGAAGLELRRKRKLAARR